MKKIKKTLIVILTVCLCAMCFEPIVIYADETQVDIQTEQESVWDGSAKEEVVPLSDNYTIDTAPKLAWFAQQVNSGNSFDGKTVLITGNINLNNKYWTPIGKGTGASNIVGTIKIEDCTIKGLNSCNLYSGLFGNVKVRQFTIDNFRLENSQSSNSNWDSYVGALFGRVEVAANGSFSILNSYFSGTSSNHQSFSGPTGGIVGSLVIGDSSNICIENVETHFQCNAGAQIGSLFAEVIDNTSTGQIHISKVNTNDNLTGYTSYGYHCTNVGGLIGSMSIGSIYLDRIVVNGKISSSGYCGYAGGLIANANYKVLQAENIAIKSEIYSSWRGVYGYVENAGGFLGYSGTTDPENSYIRNSYVVGKINDGVAFCSHCQSSSKTVRIENCYFDKDTTTVPANKLMCTGYADLFGISDSNSKALSTDAMKQKESYVGWDFDHVWDIAENEYPALRWLFNTEDDLTEPVEFTLGRDNNTFSHTPNSFFFNTEEDYRIISDAYWSALCKDQSENYCNLLLEKQYEKWLGSCYGISASILYGYNKGYDITHYLSEDNMDYPYYMAAGIPVENEKLKDLIQVFQLSQYRSDVTYTDRANNSFAYKIFGIGSSIKKVLKGIVDEAEKSNYLKPFLFGITYKGGGHALLICGSAGEENGYYKIAICDPNGSPVYNVNSEEYVYYYDKYSYLMISTDYTSFHMENEEGEVIYSKRIDSDNFKEIKYVTYEDAYSKANKNQEDFCEIIVDVDSPFYMTTDNGTYLSYDGEEFSGNAVIENVSTAINNVEGRENASWIIELSGINKVSFSKIASTTEVDCLFDSDEYINVTGRNLSAISIEDDKGVSIEGKGATYTLCMSAKDDSNTLIQSSGTMNDTAVSYLYDGTNIQIEGIDNKSDITLNKITDEGISELNEATDPSVNIKQNETNEGAGGSGSIGGETSSSGSISGSTGGGSSSSDSSENSKPDSDEKTDIDENSGNKNDDPVTVTVPEKGTLLTDSSTKMVYKVTKSGTTGGTVQFVKIKSTKAKNLTIPATVTFDGITYKVTSIAANALKNNTTVVTVSIGKYVTSIGSGAFSGCTKLKKVTVGKSVTTIGSKAFYKCTSLTSITLPSKVAKIENYAFKGCSKLNSIKINTTLLTSKTVSERAFSGISTKVVIKVPKEKLKTYQKLLAKKGLNKKVTVK
ncbi:MAG: leucine-rich repeat domain-containing protein [Lachnospiraceae bacterium]